MSKMIVLAASLPASPDRLFDMYLDPALHAAISGGPVEIAARPGAAFRAFDGKIWGAILHVVARRLIVQTWRSVNFPDAADNSILILQFSPEGQSGRIDLTQVNVPEEDFAGISHGWEKFYWTPWRAYLADSAGC